MKKMIIFFLLGGMLNCNTNQPANPNPASGSGAQIANPASQNCLDKGGKLEIRTNSAGQYGICVFTDGSECEEWVFFRGTCRHGQTKK